MDHITRKPGWDAKIIHTVAKERYGTLLGMFEHHGWDERGSDMMRHVQRRVCETYGSVESFAAAHSNPSRMRILGIDFTSNPSRRKPITCLNCTLQDGTLYAGELEEWSDFAAFETALQQPGPWIAGIDFPFGQSRRFIKTIGWPSDWQGYISHAASLGRQEFRDTLDAYKKPRADGDKEHRRNTDIAASSISPQKLYGVPVGLMFFEGAQRLVTSGVTVPHMQAGDPDRIVVEAYPGVLVRQFIGRRSYKNDTRKKQTQALHEARVGLFRSLHSSGFKDRYGLNIEAPGTLCDDPGGDHLDALLCAIQAAWAWGNQEARFGAPDHVDTLEGWIADPSLSTAVYNR